MTRLLPERAMRLGRTAVLVYGSLLLASWAAQYTASREQAPTTSDAPGFTRHDVRLPAQNAQGPLADRRIRVSYRESGKGPAVVLLHGSPGRADMYRAFAPYLSASHRVIAVDLPGFGESELWAPDYGIRAHARTLGALLDAIGVERAHVLGFSMGSGVGFELAGLAPSKVRSLAVYGGIGLQEGEGSGDYTLERIKYGAGYLFLVLAPELLPHFGVLGNFASRHAFIRNFWDTDLRPLRGVIESLSVPLLIMHGRNDPLVPAWVAQRHHQMVAGSELVLYDDSHFMLYRADGTRTIARDFLAFITRVERGATARNTVAQHGFQAGQRSVPPSPQTTPPDRMNPWVQVAGIMVAAFFVNDDLTCLTTGLAAREGRIDPVVGLLACFFAVWLGDLLLWLLGYAVGRPILSWRGLRARLPVAQLERFEPWFAHNGWRAVLVSRFVPGTRLPLYVAAGVVGTSLARFASLTFLAVLIWTPIVVIGAFAFGPAVAVPMRSLLGNGPVTLLLSGAVLYGLARLVSLVLTRDGRTRLALGLEKFKRWEFWPAWVFYIPVYFMVAGLALRHRSLMAPTAANPAIPDGGVVGESKHEILRHLEPTTVVRGRLIDATADSAQRTLRALAAIDELGLSFPVILKPDASQRGVGLHLAQNHKDVAAYFASEPGAVLLQEFHAGPFEAGVFYYRLPEAPTGTIFSITDKTFPRVTGDGSSTLAELVGNHERYRMQIEVFRERLGRRWSEVPAAGTEVALAIAGNHCQGTMFTDGEHLITVELRAALDRVVADYHGFYFGRFDIRYSDPETFKAGRDLQVIELNGAFSESTNIYDPRKPIWFAYATLYRQWELLFRIGDANRRNGHPVTPLRELLATVFTYYRTRAPARIAD